MYATIIIGIPNILKINNKIIEISKKKYLIALFFSEKSLNFRAKSSILLFRR